jgi:H+/Cl- antiporter ClcA
MWSMAYEDFSARSLMLFIPTYFLFAAWTSGLAIPSGSFSPAVFLGSCIGRLCAHFLAYSGIVEKPDAGLYALLGAAGFFTGMLHPPQK